MPTMNATDERQPPPLDLDLVQCFVEVARTQSFTSASKRLFRTQSAISVRIRRLEQLLGTRLFVRTSRSVQLTIDGERFLAHASRLLAANYDAIQSVTGRPRLTRLRLGIVEYLAPHRLPAILRDAQQSLPGVEVTTRADLSAELLRLLDRGELDLVIVKHQPDRPGGRVVMSEPMHWIGATHCVPNPLCPDLCLIPGPCAFRSAALDALTAAGRSWTEVVTSSSVMAVQACVRAGLGVTVLGASSLAPGLRALSPIDGWPPLDPMQISAYGTVDADVASRILRMITGTDSALPAPDGLSSRLAA